MAKLYNLARMTTSTTGTGTITLGSAVSGYLTFAEAGAQDGETVTYGIRDGANSEVGRGVYTVSGTTLTRSVLKSTNSDAAISLSGSAEVYITAVAEDVYLDLGAKVYNDASIAIPTATWRAITFNTEVYDTDGIHSTVSNTSRLTCQTAGKYLIVGNITLAASATGAARFAVIRKNQTTDTTSGRIGQSNGVINGTIAAHIVVSTIEDLIVTDWVELVAYHDAGADLNVTYTADFTPYFMMQRIG